MFDLLMRSAPERSRSLSSRGLTPNDSRALHSLKNGEALPMRALATAWGCDPSNATWIVDRLESLGLAERRAASSDRRVKLVALTAKGERTKRELLDEFYQPPADLAALDRADLEELLEILGKLR
jgi:DNA-binding MarR family transcriptional regulator